MLPRHILDVLATLDGPADRPGWLPLFGEPSPAARPPLLLWAPGSPHLVLCTFDPAHADLIPAPAAWELMAFALPDPGPSPDADAVTVGLRMAAAMLADQVGVDIEWPPTLAQVADIDVVDILLDDLPERISPREVAHGAGVDLEQLVRLDHDRVDPSARLRVRGAARHALTDAARAQRAVAAIRAGDLQQLGRLLDEAHNSLRQDAAMSSPAADRLCALLRRGGAAGARAVIGDAGLVCIAVAPADAAPGVRNAADQAAASTVPL